MGMAEVPKVERDYPYQGMAEKIKVVRSGHVAGLSFVFPVCDICGSLLVDQERHDNFHQDLEESLRALGLLDPEDSDDPRPPDPPPAPPGRRQG